MFDTPRFTAQDALDLIVAGKPPLDFGSGLPVYRAAVKQIARISISSLITCDLTAVPMNLAFLNLLAVHFDRHPPASVKERKKQREWMSRLRTIARRLEDIPVVQTSPAWAACLMAVKGLAAGHRLAEEDLIPLATLRQAAVEEGLDPAELTGAWLTALMQKSGPRRRGSLRRAAKLLDDLREELPPHLRPVQPFGLIEIQARRRKSNPLPPQLSQQLETYLARRVRGTMLPGLTGEVQVQEGIKPDQSTNVYRQALGWMFDSLCFAGLVHPQQDALQISDIARLDWLSRVAVTALAEFEVDEEDSVLPWQPIKPETIYSRTTCLILLFSYLSPQFKKQTVSIPDPETHQPTTVDAEGLKKLLSSHLSNEITDAHKEFCRKIVAEPAYQRLMLNMHMICWHQAQAQWSTYETQGQHERMQTINLCILSAILAIVVHIPFRARTVVEMRVGGDRPDLSLPPGTKRIEFHIAPRQMKIPKQFDAVLEDTRGSRPRQILEWFISGPREELLRNSFLLRKPQPDRLFGGIGTNRYNRILVDWTEESGLRMTTHLFRHALASLLINCCEVPIEEVAGLLGNTVSTVERNYVFHDRIRQRSKTVQKLADFREHLSETHHPGRRRKI